MDCGVRESVSLPTHTSRLWRRCRIERGEVADCDEVGGPPGSWVGQAPKGPGVGCLAGTGPPLRWGGLSTSQPPVLCSGTMVSWEGAWPAFTPPPWLLNPTSSLLRVIFLVLSPFLGRRRGRENGQAVEGLLRILEQQACSSMEASVELIIFPPLLRVAERGGVQGPWGLIQVRA